MQEGLVVQRLLLQNGLTVASGVMSIRILSFNALIGLKPSRDRVPVGPSLSWLAC